MEIGDTGFERQEFDLRIVELKNTLREFEEYGFDSETIDEICSMPFEETEGSEGAFATAYSYLMQMGLNPDEILSQFMEDPETDAE